MSYVEHFSIWKFMNVINKCIKLDSVLNKIWNELKIANRGLKIYGLNVFNEMLFERNH